MIRTIEKHFDAVIQKVYNHKSELIAYQAGRPGNSATMTRCSSLGEARKAIGIEITPPTIHTKPKLENPQNQKGYKAPTR